MIAWDAHMDRTEEIALIEPAIRQIAEFLLQTDTAEEQLEWYMWLPSDYQRAVVRRALLLLCDADKKDFYQELLKIPVDCVLLR